MTIFTLFTSILVLFTIVFLFILISTDNWVFLVFFHVMTFLYLSAYWLSHMKQ